MTKSRFVAVGFLVVLVAILAHWIRSAPTVLIVHCEATEAAPTACSGSNPAKPLQAHQGPAGGSVSKPGANSNGSVPMNLPKEI